MNEVVDPRYGLTHREPLCKDGLHARSNVALAHVSCNTARGVDRLPAQLLLIG